MKKPLILIAAFMVTSLVLYALVSRDQPARHSGLRAVKLPPLISMHDLYPLSKWTAENLTSLVQGATDAWRQTEAVVGGLQSRLVLPQTGSLSVALPAVVLIDSGFHGPNRARTLRLLVNRGYAVLLIDCRNTGIHSLAMTTDHVAPGGCNEFRIADEARDLVKRGIADPAAMAISGSGAGGTLALMTMSLEPDLFRAAFVYSPAMLEAQDLYTSAVLQEVKHERMSPGDLLIRSKRQIAGQTGKTLIDLIRSVPGAVLMIHDRSDNAHDLDQAAARELMARKHNVKIYDIKLEDHSYSGWQTHVKVARLTETFLARHLGGRNGGYDYIELLAKLF